MHSDLAALDVVCACYRTEYNSDALRIEKNKIHRLLHQMTRVTIELYYLKVLLKVWRTHARNIRDTITSD